MNYHKLLFSTLIMAILAVNPALGMQKQSQFSDFKNQALSWISENKTVLIAGSCAAITAGLLYRYFTKPEPLEKQIQRNKRDLEKALAQKFDELKNDAPFITAHGGLRDLLLPNGKGYTAAYFMVKNQENELDKLIVICRDKSSNNAIAYQYAGKVLQPANQHEIQLLKLEAPTALIKR